MRRDGCEHVGMKTLEENLPPDHRPDQAQSAQRLFPHRPASARARFPQYPCWENHQRSRFLECLDMSSLAKPEEVCQLLLPNLGVTQHLPTVVLANSHKAP